MRRFFSIRRRHKRQGDAPGAVRTLFLSDFHLGAKNFDARALASFLATVQPDILYLNGDIIDGWKLQKRWHWTVHCTRVIDALVDHGKRGAKIIYLPGNHDDAVRRLPVMQRIKLASSLGIKITNIATHKTRIGKHIVVLHGDQFDRALVSGRIAHFGDWLYSWAADLFGIIKPPQIVLINGSLKPFSLATALVRSSGKMALRLLNNFRRMVIRTIKRRNAQGLICGHTHVAALKNLRGDFIFGNTGMWLGPEHAAIIETTDGELKLLRIPASLGWRREQDLPLSPAMAVAGARNAETALIIRRIHQLWPGQSFLGEAEGVGLKPLERQLPVINDEGGNTIDIGAKTALADKFIPKP